MSAQTLEPVAETIQAVPQMYAKGKQLEPKYTGRLKDSSGLLGNMEALRRRMEEEGYLYLPGYLDRRQVMEGRRAMTERLASLGLLKEGTDPMEAIPAEGTTLGFNPKYAEGIEPLRRLLFGGRMMEFYERFLGGAVSHFDYIWPRTADPGGVGTTPHCDIVFMGRGTHRLYTSWTPLGEVPFESSGLMILEGSCRNRRLRQRVAQVDVDAYCVNHAGSRTRSLSRRGGGFATPPTKLPKVLGGRWLRAHYHVGDVLIFGMFTVHGATDNRTDRLRLSTDSRYQLAAEPVDERWIGEHPLGHGENAKRGLIC